MKRNRRGSQAVEFALILPILLAISSAIIDYGWYFNQRHDLMQAMRMSIRTASMMDSQESPYSPCEYIQQDLNQTLNESGYPQGGRILSTQIGRESGESRITVVLKQPFLPLFGLVTTPQNGAVRATFRLEDQSWEGC